MSLYRLDSIRPQVGEDVWIAPDAAIIGNVHLADRANIWFHAVLRGDNDPIRIGRESNIQDGSILHTDAGFPLTVGERVTIGHQVILHSCTVGDGSLIGMGAVILNRAVIGRHCIVGAHSLISEGKTFPERVLIVGSPGRVVRDLTDAEVVRLEESSRHYVENATRFKRALASIQP
ncbi:MAG: gamma carbonic anhydrase family protein [Zoogloeaceae bacterium]|jgi:carbonic anhydrase/acetyltransferase-like protein (isoleucine patch superfamily)|nr:gamma carbonic anhydrase family protein [Zoogloeaceae bacterium]